MEPKQLRVEADKCHIMLNVPIYLTEATIPMLRKMFALICRYSYQNEQTIQDMEPCLSDILEDYKKIWANESLRFQEEYRDPKFHSKTREEAAAIRLRNDRLMKAAKLAKKDYERFQRIIDIWNETKTKYYIKEN